MWMLTFAQFHLLTLGQNYLSKKEGRNEGRHLEKKIIYLYIYVYVYVYLYLYVYILKLPSTYLMPFLLLLYFLFLITKASHISNVILISVGKEKLFLLPSQVLYLGAYN